MRVSLRTKLISTSALLIAFVVAVFGVVANTMVREDLATDQARVIERRMREMRQSGVLLTEMLAQGALPLVADRQIPNLDSLVSRLVAEGRHGALEIRGAAILDDRGAPLSVAPSGFDGASLRAAHPETGAAPGEAVAYDRPDPDGVASAFVVLAPVRDQGLELGTAVVSFGTGALSTELAEIEASTAARISANQRNTAILGGLALLLGVLIAVAQSLRIVNPILRLAGKAEKIAAGRLDVRANVRSNDEIGVLGASFDNMADRLTSLLDETAEKASLEKELEVARVVQETLLPPVGVVSRPPLEIYGYFRSASVCGGDFWNVVDLDDGRTLIVVGDVTGHGVPSAMITATAKACLDTLRSIRGSSLSLTYLLEEMNKTIFASAKRKFVMTLFALTFDRARNELAFANAGHNFPLLLRRQDETLDVQGLVARGNRLGDVEDSRFTEHRMSVRPGDLIAMYTDGITEFRDAAGQEYGERRFRRALQGAYGGGVRDVGEALLADLTGFAGEAPQEDDITLVVISLGRPAASQVLAPAATAQRSA